MHNFNIRIYYEDTDAGGIVYYANYLKFAERARTEFLRDIGIIQSEVTEEFGLYFVVKKAEINFKSPAKLDDLVCVKTNINKLSKVSLLISQSIILNKKELCSVLVKIACVDKNMKPTAIPQKNFKLNE